MNTKIALCLSGQLRFIEEGYYRNIFPFILHENDIDVFIHTWAVDDDQNGKPYINGGNHLMGGPVDKSHMLDVFNLYNPVRYLIQKQVPFSNDKYSDRLMPGIKSHNLFSMFYSIYKSNELKRQHELENDFKYDIVVRSRFDIKLDKKIDFSLNTSKLQIPFNCFDPSNGYVDGIGYSNSEIMDVYSDTFNNIDSIMDRYDMRLCGEYVLRKQIDDNGIQVEQNFSHSLYR
jgi:hypothetical protein